MDMDKARVAVAGALARIRERTGAGRADTRRRLFAHACAATAHEDDAATMRGMITMMHLVMRDSEDMDADAQELAERDAPEHANAMTGLAATEIEDYAITAYQAGAPLVAIMGIASGNAMIDEIVMDEAATMYRELEGWLADADARGLVAGMVLVSDIVEAIYADREPTNEDIDRTHALTLAIKTAKVVAVERLTRGLPVHGVRT